MVANYSLDFALVRIPNAAYNGQKFIKPVAIKIAATIPSTISNVPPIIPVYHSTTIASATIIRIIPSVLLMFFFMSSSFYRSKIQRQKIKVSDLDHTT